MRHYGGCTTGPTADTRSRFNSAQPLRFSTRPSRRVSSATSPRQPFRSALLLRAGYVYDSACDGSSASDGTARRLRGGRQHRSAAFQGQPTLDSTPFNLFRPSMSGSRARQSGTPWRRAWATPRLTGNATNVIKGSYAMWLDQRSGGRLSKSLNQRVQRESTWDGPSQPRSNGAAE
jgi:hypothetical protein